jgi:GntR family histidine utilization transcriptional repressor
VSWDGLASGARVLLLVCRHTAGDTPFCLEDRLINLSAVPSAEQAEFSAIAPSVWLLNQVPWSEAEHRISAQAADQHAAAVLGIPVSAPCLVVERQTWNAGEPVTMVRLTYPAALHAVVARFSPAV